jgi:hypothetical protein
MMKKRQTLSYGFDDSSVKNLLDSMVFRNKSKKIDTAENLSTMLNKMLNDNKPIKSQANNTDISKTNNKVSINISSLN